MKTWMMVVALSATAVAFGENESCAAPTNATTAAAVQQLTPEARREAHKAARAAAERRQAEKKGITVEELRARKKARHDERLAKRLGITIEELNALTPQERKAKMAALRKTKKAARSVAVKKEVSEKKEESK